MKKTIKIRLSGHSLPLSVATVDQEDDCINCWKVISPNLKLIKILFNLEEIKEFTFLRNIKCLLLIR